MANFVKMTQSTHQELSSQTSTFSKKQKKILPNLQFNCNFFTIYLIYTVYLEIENLNVQKYLNNVFRI